MELFAKERQDKIIQMLSMKGSVATTELIEEFRVSIETVRRDLLELERQGLLQRVHGGAVAVGEMKAYESLPQRLEENREAKDRLCETGAGLVAEGEILYVDCGSTAVHFAKALACRFERLTVVTHSMEVFEILTQKEGFQVVLCAGHYKKAERAFYGQLALNMLRSVHVQKAFLFPAAVSLQSGVGDFDEELLQMQHQIMNCTDKVYFLADSEKFEKRAFLKLCDMSAKHIYVTDSGLSSNFKQLYEEKQFHVITSPEENFR